MADLQTLRTALLGAVQGQSGGTFIAYSGRCIQGYLPLTRATGSGLWSASTGSGSGAFVHVGAGACIDSDAANRNQSPIFEVVVDVWVGVDKDVANNLSGVVTFIETIRRALDDVLSRGGSTYDAPDVLYAGPVALLHYSMRCMGAGCG